MVGVGKDEDIDPDPGWGLVPPPQLATDLAQTGSVCLEGVQLGEDCVGQLGRVLWAPGG